MEPAEPSVGVYVADAENKRILTLDCSPHDCSEPRQFASSDQFVNPTMLAVTSDAYVWVGDIGAQKIFAFGPDGSLRQVSDRLPQR